MRFKVEHYKKILSKLRSNNKFFKVFYELLSGLPSINYSEINESIIHKLVGKDNPTIIEIGCNDGNSTLWFFEVFKNPQVFCFEPDPRAIERFKKKVGQHPNIQLFEIAISDKNGEIDFYQSSGKIIIEQYPTLPEDWDLSGSIRQPKEHLTQHPFVKFNKKIKVQTSTLDNWCHEHRIRMIDFIWMDVQGAEIDVFRGARNILKKTRFIYFEYSKVELYQGQFNLKKLMKYLKYFEIILRYPGDVLLRNIKNTIL